MSEPITHTIELQFGYTDKAGVCHKSVTFGKRLTGGDMMHLDNDPQAQNPTQYMDMIRRRAITSFGLLKMPVGLNILLGLNKLDRQDIGQGLETFLEIGAAELTIDYREGNTVKLRFGFDIDGTIYDLAHIENLTTGLDEVAADSLNLKGLSRECFMLGRMISKLSVDDSPLTLDGPVDLDKFNNLDANDISALRIGARLAELSFRLAGKTVSGEWTGEDGVSADADNGNERGADTQAADAAAK